MKTAPARWWKSVLDDLRVCRTIDRSGGFPPESLQDGPREPCLLGPIRRRIGLFNPHCSGVSEDATFYHGSLSAVNLSRPFLNRPFTRRPLAMHQAGPGGLLSTWEQRRHRRLPTLAVYRQRKMRRERAKGRTSQARRMATGVSRWARFVPWSMLPRMASMAAVKGRARTKG